MVYNKTQEYKKDRAHGVRTLVVAVAVVLLDQFLKQNSYYTVVNVGLGTGVASPVLPFLAHLLVLAALLFWTYGNRASRFTWGIVLAAVVSVSNLLDRLLIGGVVDYWQVLGVWFNLADLVISIIFFYLVINYLAWELKHRRNHS